MSESEIQCKAQYAQQQAHDALIAAIELVESLPLGADRDIAICAFMIASNRYMIACANRDR